jgi:hypothetical protein
LTLPAHLSRCLGSASVVVRPSTSEHLSWRGGGVVSFTLLFLQCSCDTQKRDDAEKGEVEYKTIIARIGH